MCVCVCVCVTGLQSLWLQYLQHFSIMSWYNVVSVTDGIWDRGLLPLQNCSTGMSPACMQMSDNIFVLTGSVSGCEFRRTWCFLWHCWKIAYLADWQWRSESKSVCHALLHMVFHRLYFLFAAVSTASSEFEQPSISVSQWKLSPEYFPPCQNCDLIFLFT